MISINRLEEMAIEELQTELKNFEEQIKLQNNFIDSLLKATNNSEWVDKSMLDDEVSEVIEKIELDYEQLDQLKAENEELKRQHQAVRGLITSTGKQNYQLLQEYDKLKTENEELRQFLSKEPLAIQALQKSYESYQKSTEVFSDWVKDYKQLITEIKEIAENGKRFAERYMITGEQKANVLTYANAILQKISEVEDD